MNFREHFPRFNPVKSAAYGAFLGVLIVVWRTDFGLPGMFDFAQLRFYYFVGELIGSAVSVGVVAYFAAVITNWLRR